MTNRVEPLVGLVTDHICHQATEFRVLAEECAAEMQESAILSGIEQMQKSEKPFILRWMSRDSHLIQRRCQMELLSVERLDH